MIGGILPTTDWIGRTHGLDDFFRSEEAGVGLLTFIEEAESGDPCDLYSSRSRTWSAVLVAIILQEPVDALLSFNRFFLYRQILSGEAVLPNIK